MADIALTASVDDIVLAYIEKLLPWERDELFGYIIEAGITYAIREAAEGKLHGMNILFGAARIPSVVVKVHQNSGMKTANRQVTTPAG